MSGQVKGQRGGRGGDRGRSRGTSRGGASSDDVTNLKENLKKSIENAEMLLKTLELDKKKKPKQQGGERKNTRGSISMGNLSSASDQPYPSGSDKRSSNVGRGNRKRGMNYQPHTHRNTRDSDSSSINQKGPLLKTPPRPLFDLQPIPPFDPPPRPLIDQQFHPRYFESGNSFVPPGIPAYEGSYYSPSFDVQRPMPDYIFNRPPPPTYDETIGVSKPPAVIQGESKSGGNKSNFDQTSVTKTNSQSKLTADTLVKTLAIFRGHYEKAETIARHLDQQPDDVLRCGHSRKDLFAIMGKGKDAMIELVPKVSLCTDYFTEQSCNAKETCEKLHICKNFVTGYCISGTKCEYGHRWDTNHNSKILSKFYLDLIEKKILHQVIKKLCKVHSKLELCSYYNSDQGCKQGTCRKLHICKNYVLGSGKCTEKDCSLNHNIVDKQCSSLLRAYGITLNESPRDILLNLTSSLGESVEKGISQIQSEKKTKDKGKPNKNKKSAASECESSSDNSDISYTENCKDLSGKAKKLSKKKKVDKEKKSVTINSTDLIGDVAVPEICVFSVDDKCLNKKSGCRYLHAKSLFHWQVEKGEKWYNLRVFQSKKLETAYRDPYQGSVEVPAIDQSKLEDHSKELLKVLGTNTWKADFQSMTMVDRDRTLKVRRLSTQSSTVFKHPKATVFEWYCQDDQGKWIKIGKGDVTGRQHHICNISSEDAEKQYLSDPLSSMLICTDEDRYKLEFSRMVQVNMLTGEEREIRRRPAGLAYQKKPDIPDDQQSSLPSHWSPMPGDQTHLLEQLDAGSNEYLDVASRVRLTIPTVFIVSIKRLQNPYLWRLLQNRKAELCKRYDENQLNMQKLFHGVNPGDTNIVCKENFDWRLRDTGKQEFGIGTYFSNSAAVGRTYCKPDEFGKNHMFLAQVIIGTVAKGDPSCTRPPPNLSTGALYDTTVDDITAPTVFVKYDKEEYYPEYVIEFY
ncbi:protein mono-ADP-ribosyltransferase PARP12-like [Palaemon carinicauda]|uniref:protein mono-ADP-ribosyltransferase PARP12-like n=1 Tax=Palaemon carinicauda TaxID=392227 RepID=UPI0035B58371